VILFLDAVSKLRPWAPEKGVLKRYVAVSLPSRVPSEG
jgi:hypothetical protein